MKKQIKIPLVGLILIVLLIIAVIVIFVVSGTNGSENDGSVNNVISNIATSINGENFNANVQLEKTADISVVPTMKDTITADSTWCGTFQLIWNDLKNEIAGQDIVFSEPMEEVNNLNLGEFNTSMISDEYYYKKYGLKTLELKDEIENGIYEKFGQTSDILDQFDWSEEELHGSGKHDFRYFLYTMLYRKFEFASHFDKLENGNFGDNYQNVSYFGIDNSTNDDVGNQVQVLYYNTEEDLAIVIKTTSGDEVIFCKNPEGRNFNEIYSNMNNKANTFTGEESFKDIDELKVPYLNMNITKEYLELEGKPFPISDQGVGSEYVGNIQKAIQSIQLTLDETGGEIKSEAGMDVTLDSMAIEEPEQANPRYFYLDDTFAMFLKEEGQSLPYFAARIDNVTKYQQQ